MYRPTIDGYTAQISDSLNHGLNGLSAGFGMWLVQEKGSAGLFRIVSIGNGGPATMANIIAYTDTVANTLTGVTVMRASYPVRRTP